MRMSLYESDVDTAWNVWLDAISEGYSDLIEQEVDTQTLPRVFAPLLRQILSLSRYCPPFVPHHPVLVVRRC